MTMAVPITEYPYRDEIEYFTEGECIQLAFEIHKRTGWDLAQVMSVEWGATRFYFCHVFVIHPDGECVDIRGKMPLPRFKTYWPGTPYFHRFEGIEEFMREAKQWKELSFMLGKDDFAMYWAKKIVEEIS